MIRILIADNHALVRMATSGLITQVLKDTAISECTTCDEMETLLQERKFDLLVLNIELPECDVFKMVQILHANQSELAILILSGNSELDDSVRYLKAGANGYADKSASPDEIKKAIASVVKHERYISPLILEQMLHAANPKETITNMAGLSNREKQVLQLLVEGNNLTTIATQLNLRMPTVSTFKNRIFKKMQVSNLFQLRDKMQSFL